MAKNVPQDPQTENDPLKGFMGFINDYRINIRPLFNGNIIKNLSIHITSNPNIFSTLSAPNTTSEKKEIVNYSGENGYLLDHQLIGTCTFELVGSDYKIVDVRSSDHSFSTNNSQITLFAISLGILRRVTMLFRGKRSMYLAGGRVQQMLFQHF
ncbi:hypothetical protein, partial [Mucilaginibacter lappiensis]